MSEQMSTDAQKVFDRCVAILREQKQGYDKQVDAMFKLAANGSETASRLEQNYRLASAAIQRAIDAIRGDHDA